MSDTKKYQNYNLKIIVNKRLKHSYISIDSEKNIILKTRNNSSSYIDSLLEEKKDWIQKQLLKIESLTLIGESPLYSLEFLQERAEYYSSKMNLKYSKLKFRKMRRRWGSCNSKREITLNKELTRIDKNLIDYVVVHELAHLKHMNHSKEFHAFVDLYLPQSKLYRKELKNIRLI